MDKKEARTAWIIAGILAVLLVIAIVFWMNAKKDLDEVLTQGYEDIGTIRDRMEADCHSTDAASVARCEQDKEDLSDLLEEFSEDIEDSEGGAPAVEPTPQ